MNIAVEIAFSFKQKMDESYRNLDLPSDATVLEGLHLLADRFPVFRERVFDDTGSIRRNINALINGSNVQFREGLNTVLHAGDRLTVLPPVGGG
ncbi:MAG: MoaD/ThiS family protein [Candidatus Atribacteria bacterium]|nr:MAG: MoaD/ThiS family protein [Candidatus Atribacteria bacterium]